MVGISIFHISSHPYGIYLKQITALGGLEHLRLIYKWPKISLPSKFLITFSCLLRQVLKKGEPETAFAPEEATSLEETEQVSITDITK